MNKKYPLYETEKINSLRDLLQKKNDQIPNNVAFTFYNDSKELQYKTYSQVYEDVNALGNLEFDLGWKGKNIAIIGGNSYEWIVIFYSIVGGGNVAIPLDKELPIQDLKMIIDKSNIDIIFASKKYLDKVNMIWSGEIYLIENVQEYIEQGKKNLLRECVNYLEYELQTENMCCVMYTSGTSGESKGVMLSNENFAADINGSCALFSLEGNTISVLPYHHAFGLIVSVFMPFNYGKTVHINKSLKFFLNDLIQIKPQTLFVVPMFIENFSRQIWEEAKKAGNDKKLKFLMKVSDGIRKIGIDNTKIFFSAIHKSFGGNLKYIICGGAMLEKKYIKEYRSWGIEILNGYGTTECSPCVAVNRNFYHKDGTVGLQLPESQIRIDSSGEVQVCGKNVMLGYYKDETATCEVLNDGWYSTGDLGFLDKEGFLTLTGRKKNLIILSNGENISPEQLERKILEYSEVQEVMVYEENKEIIAEIFPVEDYIGNEKFFVSLLKKINHNEPIYRRIKKIKLRETEFLKNTSKKIIRSRV